MSEGDTWVNSFIGGIITIVFGGFVPLMPLAGGAIAGYLQGGSRGDGLKVGAIAGLIAWVPFALLMVFAASLLNALNFDIPIFGPEGVILGSIGDGLGTLLIGIAIVLGFVYFVGFGTIGGWLGNYVKYDTDVDI